MNKKFHNLGIVAALLLIACCFLPWTFYVSIDETFTGFHVKRFAADNYYGRAGIPITLTASIILLFIFIPRLWAKRVNLFLSAFLFAYCIRTYIIFTGSLFEGEVEKKSGIYGILICSFLLLLSSVFPKKDHTR